MLHKFNINNILRKLTQFSLGLALCSQLQAVEIPGGDMESGISDWTAENDALLLQDTKTAKDGKASLLLHSDDPAAKDKKAVLKFPISGEQQFTFSTYIKAEGIGIGGALGVMAVANNMPVGGWQHVTGITAGDWKQVTKVVNVPDNANQIMVILTLNGKGKVWLDSMSGGNDGSASSGSAVSLEQEDISRFNGPAPTITNIGAVHSHMLCVEIREKKHVWGKLVKYKPQDGDKIINKKVRKEDGAILERKLQRNGKEIGSIVGPDNNLHLQAKQLSTTGKVLHRNNALKPETWTIKDSAGKILKVSKVALKQKPLGPAGKEVRDNWYALTLDQDLRSGETYSLDVGQHNMKQDLTFDPSTTRSEAVHVSHIGYRPDDSVKLGFLSYWSGTGGPINYADGLKFALINTKSGKTVFDGKTQLRMRKSQASYGTHAKGRNYAMSDVYVCDFSSFNKSGNYVLSVDGIGCSFPFDINRDAWTTAAKNSLRGFFHQRAGQEWKAPWADWDQPRAFHPDNGEDYWELSKSQLDIAASGKRHENVMDHGMFDKWKTGKKVKNAWGGYYDAGDYDRHSGHLVCSRNMLELLELFPDYYNNLELPIPETNNNIPDVLDESLWCINLYKRTQREDGAIYGGIETNGHPKAGEPAFLDSLTRYVFAPDPRCTWLYVASASRAAFVFKQYGFKKESEDYLQSALKAMAWAEKEYASKKDYFEGINSWWRIKDTRNLAAVALYRMTEDKQWNAVFEETCIFKDNTNVVLWNVGNQEEAAFIYARLPETLINAEIKKNAIAGIEAAAQRQITYSDGTCFMWTGPNGDPGFPLIISINAAPQGQPLCRAYALTNNNKYLDYALKTSFYSVGANPQNMTFTTRLGHRSPEFPLQCIRMYMHTDKPYSGYTVYGLAKMGKTPSWISQWFVTKNNSAPQMDTWPIAESYWDVESWPMMNENTVQQSMSPAVYVWGFLAGRK